MKRHVIQELLDSDTGSAAQIQQSLADLRRINRWFGGSRVMRKLVTAARTSDAKTVTYLDVAGASGDIAASLARNRSHDDFTFLPTVLDRSLAHRPRALPFVCGDALHLPFKNGCFDFVGCSLFAHHLEPREIVQFVNEGLRVSRVGVLINDLRRSVISLALVYAGFPLFRSPITRHDAPASVRRSYTLAEMSAILKNTQAVRWEARRFYLFRMGLIVWKNPGGPQQ